MATTRVTRTTTHGDDPLGYSGTVEQRLRRMAEDAVAGKNADAVHEEAAILRARLRPERQVVALPKELPAEFVDELERQVAQEPKPDPLDRLLDDDPGEFTP